MARGRKPKTKGQHRSFKRANGTGSIKKLSGNRRKPYCVLITTGTQWIPEQMKNKQIQKSIGTFKTFEEAEAALANYNLNPYNIDTRSVTFGEIYEIWKKHKFEKISEKTMKSYETAYKYCSCLKDEPISKIKTAQLQYAIDKCDKSSATKDNMKIVMNGVFNYCMENDIVSKNYADYITIERSEATFDRILFSKKEIDYLWSISDNYDAQILLILLYTGMRVNELLKNKRSNYDPDAKTLFIPKELAKNNTSVRYVPIHKKILPLINQFYERSKDALIVKPNGSRVMYNNFVSRELKKLNTHFEAVHRLHDTRHTFVTQAHILGMDDLIVKKIIGHAANGTTARVYTHISLEEEFRELNKLEY